jgi:hypothetical protein
MSWLLTIRWGCPYSKTTAQWILRKKYGDDERFVLTTVAGNRGEAVVTHLIIRSDPSVGQEGVRVDSGPTIGQPKRSVTMETTDK